MWADSDSDTLEWPAALDSEANDTEDLGRRFIRGGGAMNGRRSLEERGLRNPKKNDKVSTTTARAAIPTAQAVAVGPHSVGTLTLSSTLISTSTSAHVVVPVVTSSTAKSAVPTTSTLVVIPSTTKAAVTVPTPSPVVLAATSGSDALVDYGGYGASLRSILHDIPVADILRVS